MRVFVLFHDSTDDYGIDKLPGLFVKPILQCGIEMEVRLLIRTPARLHADPHFYDARMVAELREFKPDIVIYSPWETIPHPLFEEAHRLNIPTLALYWDTRTQLGRFELDIFEHCNYVAVADSLATYYRLSLLNRLMHRHERTYNTIFCSGYLIDRANYPKLDMPKTRDVLLLGSLEASRIELVDQLKQRLSATGIGFEQLGGIIPGSKNLSPEEYIACVNGSKILICSQTQPARVQIKNKVYEFLSCGAFVLVDRNYEYESVIPGDCVAYYDDFDDMVAKIEYYMAHEAEREAIAARGFAWYRDTYDIPAFWRRTLNAIVAHRGDTLPAPSVLRQDNTNMLDRNPCFEFIERETDDAMAGFGFRTLRRASSREIADTLLQRPDGHETLIGVGYRRSLRRRVMNRLHGELQRVKPRLRELLPSFLYVRLRAAYGRLYRLI